LLLFAKHLFVAAMLAHNDQGAAHRRAAGKQFERRGGGRIEAVPSSVRLKCALVPVAITQRETGDEAHYSQDAALPERIAVQDRYGTRARSGRTADRRHWPGRRDGRQALDAL
jgi:hypothetical protein